MSDGKSKTVETYRSIVKERGAKIEKEKKEVTEPEAYKNTRAQKSRRKMAEQERWSYCHSVKHFQRNCIFKIKIQTKTKRSAKTMSQQRIMPSYHVGADGSRHNIKFSSDFLSRGRPRENRMHSLNANKYVRFIEFSAGYGCSEIHGICRLHCPE